MWQAERKKERSPTKFSQVRDLFIYWDTWFIEFGWFSKEASECSKEESEYRTRVFRRISEFPKENKISIMLATSEAIRRGLIGAIGVEADVNKM